MTDFGSWLKSTHREVRRTEDHRSLVLRRRFDSSREDVWRACTDRERLGRWFGDVSGDLHEGGAVAVDVGMPEKVICQIMRCDRPHRLAVTWSYGGDALDPVDQVELRLSVDGEGTLFELEHRSVATTNWWLGVGPGWEDWIFRLSVLLHGGDPAEVSSEAIQPQLGPLWAAV